MSEFISKWAGKFAEKLGVAGVKTVDYAIESGTNRMVKDTSKRDMIAHQMNEEILVHSLKPEMFRTPYMKDQIKRLKKEAKESHTSIMDWLDGVFAPFIGKAIPEVLLEAVGAPKSEFPKPAQDFIDLMGLIADIGVLTGYVDTIATALSFTLVRKIGSFMDRIISYSGMGMVTGYGLGTAFGSALTPMIQYTINHKATPLRPDMMTLMQSLGRFKMPSEVFLDELRYQGINPEQHVTVPEGIYGHWYTSESIVANPFRPDLWEPMTIDTWGKLYETLAMSPARYFELMQAARAGFYDREIFTKALQDSSYGPLPMAIILQATESAMIKRHMTAYEDELNDSFLAGEIDDEDYLAGLRDIYPQEDIVQTIYKFFQDKQMRTRRTGIRELVKEAYLAGRMTEPMAKGELIAAGYKAKYVDMIMDSIKDAASSQAELTVSQLLRIYKAGIWTKDKVKGRLANRGYDPEDLDALMALYKKEGAS